MTNQTHQKRTLRGAIVAGLVLAPLLSACAAKQETVVTRSTTAIEERTVAVPKSIAISIVDLHDEPAPDPSQEKVVGTVVNDGDKAVTGLSIKVNALNSSGQIVRSITTPPLAETIAAGGGRTRFEAFLPADPAVAGYHAVAIAK